MNYIGLLTDEQKRRGLFVTQDEDCIYLWFGRDGDAEIRAVYPYVSATVKEIREKAEEVRLKEYRLWHRITHKFCDVVAGSAQEACDKVGWLIGDTWVREKSQGQYAHGWRKITKREVR